MPGVYLEYIKAGKYVVPVEINFQAETVPAPNEMGGSITTSKWIERHNWKEIKAMLKPAVEACLKYNDTPAENIPKSHHISYGQKVSLGYLIIPNKFSCPLLCILDTKKNCWTDDEDDEDELLGIKDTSVQMEDHGSEFTEFIPTKTAIRVVVVRKSVVSIDDARRIRKELGVRSEDVRNYFSSANHLSKDPGSSSATINPENFDKERRVSEWAASAINYSQLRGSGNIGFTTQPSQSSCGNLFNSDQQGNRDIEASIGTSPKGSGHGSDSEEENIPRTFGDPDEIRDAARIYPHVLNRDREVDSGEDPDDDLSLPDIEPNPPKRKKGRSRKKSASLSPSKSKRLTHANILAISTEGQAAFSEEDATYTKRGTKKSKRKRTVAVVEPMRTLPNGQISFELAIGALATTDKRRKPRPGSSHGTDKAHSSGGRSKQPPAIDIVAPDDDRLTIKNPPEPLEVAVAGTSTTHFSPIKEAENTLELEKKNQKKKKKKRVNIDDDPHKYERLTPSPLFSDDEAQDSGGHWMSSHSESELEMPVLMKMVDSGDEANLGGIQGTNSENPKNTEESSTSNSTVAKSQATTEVNESHDKSEEEGTPVLNKEPNQQISPDITQIKANATLRKKLVKKRTVKKRLKMPSYDEDEEYDDSESEVTSKSTKASNILEAIAGPPQPKITHITLRSETKSTNSDNGNPKKPTESVGSANETELNTRTTPEKTSPIQTKPLTTSPIASKSAEQKKPDKVPDEDRFETPKLPHKARKKKKMKNAKKKVNMPEKEKAKPATADGQTQTEELMIIAQIDKRDNALVSNAIVKVSRSCDVSSEDEFFDVASQRSRRSLLASPFATSETSQSANTIIYHPALGSPETEIFEDDGLFSFESPSVPAISGSQRSLVSLEEQNEHACEVSNSPEKACPEDNNSPDTENSHEEILKSPSSPQPGCSHWSSSPIDRPPSLPPLTQSSLMPPPQARPPRTPRKLFERENETHSLRPTASSPEPVDFAHDQEETDDTLPVGAEAATVSEDAGSIFRRLHPGVLRASVMLMQRVATENISIEDIRNTIDRASKEDEPMRSRALVPVSAAQRKRNLSPDICDIQPDKRLKIALDAARRSRKDSFDESKSYQSANGETNTNAVVVRTSDADGTIEMENANNNDQLMEYLSAARPGNAAYEPHGDEFDLSQRSYCMLKVVPEYDIKSRLYKIHSKAIRDTSVTTILEHYRRTQNDLFGIYRGTIPSERHDIYLKGHTAKKLLRSLRVTVPFSSAQVNAVTTMIYDKLIPDRHSRCDYMEYVDFVLVPEAFIRIYARINNIPFNMAEIEMRYRACYQGEVQKYLTNDLSLD